MVSAVLFCFRGVRLIVLMVFFVCAFFFIHTLYDRIDINVSTFVLIYMS